MLGLEPTHSGDGSPHFVLLKHPGSPRHTKRIKTRAGLSCQHQVNHEVLDGRVLANQTTLASVANKVKLKPSAAQANFKVSQPHHSSVEKRLQNIGLMYKLRTLRCHIGHFTMRTQLVGTLKCAPNVQCAAMKQLSAAFPVISPRELQFWHSDRTDRTYWTA